MRVYSRVLSGDEISALALGESIPEIARKAAAERTDIEKLELHSYFIENAAPADVREASERLAALREDQEKLERSFPTVMVMAESPVPKSTFLLVRGAYDHPGDKVSPGVPSVLPPLPPGAPNNRLGFAEWLIDPQNPLLARVTRESILANVLRHRTRQDRRGFRIARRMAVASGAARLAGRGVRAQRLGCQSAAKIDRHQRDIPAVVEGDAGFAPARS